MVIDKEVFGKSLAARKKKKIYVRWKGSTFVSLFLHES